ncbi:hypothetical protein, partial [Staphylococcus aureus]|uniref:hypothetical protein n=1 Tax=Staphylococcus aureus TaxID=1280 RepID=UPI001CB791DA
MMAGAMNWRRGCARGMAAAVVLAGLAGCKSNGAESAWQLIQQQQQEQALARQQEDEAQGRN